MTLGEKRNAYRNLVGKPEGKDRLMDGNEMGLLKPKKGGLNSSRSEDRV